MATLLSKSETSYIASGLLDAEFPTRGDGRSLLDFRTISVETGIAPSANGSGRAIIGSATAESVGMSGPSTEAIVATRLEIEDFERDDDDWLTCIVTCTASAYPYHSYPQLDELSEDMSNMLRGCLSASKIIRSSQLVIVPQKKRWHLHIEAVVICDAGNLLDCLVTASRAALWDLRIPKTRPLQYEPETKGNGMDVEMDEGRLDALGSAVKGAKQSQHAIDFELEDYWDDGLPLQDREVLPVCVTLNVLPPVHFLDATDVEERAVPLKLHLTFAFPRKSGPRLLNTRLVGSGELPSKLFIPLIETGEKYARDLSIALNTKLKKDEELRCKSQR